MKFQLLSATVLFVTYNLVFCQRFLNDGQEPKFDDKNYGPQQYGPLRAVAVVQGNVTGVIYFEQNGYSGPGYGRVRVTGTVEGLSPGLHGFHVHQFGDTTNGCTSAGPHFNPYNREHGAPNDYIRHVGDLGNIYAELNGRADIDITDNQLTLYGWISIIGRAIVVHEKVDDLGRGGTELSKTTGNAGGRLGCGIIAWAQQNTTAKA